MPGWAGVAVVLIGLAVYLTLHAETRESIMAGVVLLFTHGLPIVP